VVSGTPVARARPDDYSIFVGVETIRYVATSVVARTLLGRASPVSEALDAAVAFHVQNTAG
jgi:hypothetical protein